MLYCCCRWGRTPLDDSIMFNHSEVEEYLRQRSSQQSEILTPYGQQNIMVSVTMYQCYRISWYDRFGTQKRWEWNFFSLYLHYAICRIKIISHVLYDAANRMLYEIKLYRHITGWTFVQQYALICILFYYCQSFMLNLFTNFWCL